MKVLIKFLKNIFSRKKEVEVSDIDENLACAILLVEVSYSDFDIDKLEIESIKNLLEKNFDLSNEKSDWLVNKALNLHKDTNCLRKYIRLINEKYSNDQKKNFITMAWEIARADNAVDKHEEHRIRKLSELLYVDHKDFIKSKISTQ